MYRFLLTFGFLFGLMPLSAHAGAYVADQMRAEVFSDYMEAKAGSVEYRELGSPPPGSIYEVSARAQNKVYDDINLYICSERDFNLFMDGRRNQCRGVNKQKGYIDFKVQVTTSGRQYLILDNSYSAMVKKKVNATVVLTAKMPPDMNRQLLDGLSKMSDSIQTRFQVQEFDFRMEPCGEKNAYSMNATGDITICTELALDLFKQKLPGALQGIFYHELGHTLLNLWGLPGGNNEEAVDEFGMVMLFWEGEQEKAFDWMRYNSEQDSAAQAEYMLQNDTKHPLSIQRLRNQKRILDNPREVISKWNRLLYPLMTKEGLQHLIDTSPKYVDRELMSQYFNQAPSAGTRTSSQSAPARKPLWGPVN